jgi:hypothetical protein
MPWDLSYSGFTELRNIQASEAENYLHWLNGKSGMEDYT